MSSSGQPPTNPVAIPVLGLPTPTTPGEVGITGLGLAAGYFSGLFLAARFPHLGVTPGAVSVYVSAAAIGCKNLWQAFLNWRTLRIEIRLHNPLGRATNMLRALDREISLDSVFDSIEYPTL